ncbi:hypothetical protein [Streptomyces sp. NPDC046161]|uniref:hypothetical protein n=1 Tax=Streptomyces sp. NPDC046161 TaxID=3155132 RepID=UPI0033EDA91F
MAAPEEEGFTVDLQHEYLGLLAVMITGRLDYRVIEVPGPCGGTTVAVVQPVPHGPSIEHEGDCAGHWLDDQLDGIAWQNPLNRHGETPR